MNVLVLVPALHGTSPGQRFRIEQWARHLEGKGFQFRFEAFETEALHAVLYQPGRHALKAARLLQAFTKRLLRLRLLHGTDVVVLYREASLIGPAILERVIAATGIPVVYDFDDPIWLDYVSPSNGRFSRLKFVGKTAGICRRAHVVTVGNRLLAEYARQHARTVHIIPSTIDLAEYPVRGARSHSDKLVLGWTGSHSTFPFLRTLDFVLKALSKESDFRLHVISHLDQIDWSDDFDFEITARRWQHASEAADIQTMDIGLAPFPNTGWTTWRCHGKVLQYMAAGIPVIASDIGILSDFIVDGVNGFLARDERQWVDKLRVLLNNPELRASMGAAGRRTIEQQFSSTCWADRFGELLIDVGNVKTKANGTP